MAEDIQHFVGTCPPGIPQTNALFHFLGLQPRIVRQVDWRVPDGPMGQFGFLLTMDGVPVLPSQAFNFVIANNEHGSWFPVGYPDSGSWQVTMFNTGVYTHSVYLTFHMDLIGAVVAVRKVWTAADLSPAPDLSKARLPPAVRGFPLAG